MKRRISGLQAKLWALKMRIWALEWGFVTCSYLRVWKPRCFFDPKNNGQDPKMPLWRLWAPKLLIWTLKRRLVYGMEPLDYKKRKIWVIKMGFGPKNEGLAPKMKV